MDREELTTLLNKLHAELGARPQVDVSTREALQALDADIQRVLMSPEATDTSQEVAANDAQATVPGDDDLNVLAQSLEVKLEADHPVLVGTLRDLMDRLGKMGI
jgi:hypothetical protein